MEPKIGDAFGAALLDAIGGGSGVHVGERDDGHVESMNADLYFSEPDEWPETDIAALDLVAGRVLDVGAGAGRHSLALQNLGCDPVALDVSPGAIEVCRRRGVVRTYLGSIHVLAENESETFDAAILLGLNLALLESDERSGTVFDTLHRLLRPGGVVVGTCRDPYVTDDPDHLAYHEWNRERGRLPGQIRLRYRCENLTTDWFDILFQSPNELSAMAARSGWRLEDITQPDPSYLAVLRPG